ncbi:gag-proteinase polyprotein [Cucumis melo var. makuwa]|uniref:Gag-proteinase polyprotein n=1 Tax=Cucumis melo var. makuwa TaxID=1194695 RepID=A0A5A7TPF7_CUCMM|nr:gag-proteinase polyprotein [Cucumis melo var. makuwa]TYK19278.1 gag-proteinase polyprotein [Cucumis melo var. makuwa]
MEIIREGPSTSRSPVLDGKNYSCWKPQMIFFIKTLDGKAWRALVAGYDPSMIIVNGVSVLKPEVDRTDVEEQASIGNARALNAIFNGVDLNVFKLINSCSTAKEALKTLEVAYEGTSKVKISRLQLITSKFEALNMTEDEPVSDYNKRVLEIANESLMLDEKIPDSKIVRKVLQSLPRIFYLKVIAIEEAHDITTLKLDELFGSLLTFEMATTDRESKKGKGIAFKFTHVSEEAVSDTKANMNESIDLLIKQFSNVIKKFKNLNTTGSNAQNLINYQRKDGENNTRRINENSNRRNSDYGRKKEGEGRVFRCRECEGVGHYQAECPTFLRRQKKNFRATLSDKDTGDGEEDNSMNAFTVCISETDSGDESECSGQICDKNFTFEELRVLWKEDFEARAIQKERIQDLMEENERLMYVISSLKLKLKEVQCEYDQTLKSVKMLNSGTENLDVILNSGQNGLNRHGLGFDTSARKINTTTEINFVPASVNDKTDTVMATKVVSPSAKTTKWICHYCGQKDHIRPFCYKLHRDILYQWKTKHSNQKYKASPTKQSKRKRSRMVWGVKQSRQCNIPFTSVQVTTDAWYFDSGCSRHMTGKDPSFLN